MGIVEQSVQIIMKTLCMFEQNMYLCGIRQVILFIICYQYAKIDYPFTLGPHLTSSNMGSDIVRRLCKPYDRH